jgi:hypothetical protein
MTLDDLDITQITAGIRLLIDAENVENVTYDTETDDTDPNQVIVAVGVEGDTRTRRFALQLRELA